MNIKSMFSNKGVAMLMAMMMMFLTLLLILSCLYLGTSKYHGMAKFSNNAKLYYAAEAGMYQAIWNCHNNIFSAAPFTVDNVKINVTISNPDSSGKRSIVVTSNF